MSGKRSPVPPRPTSRQSKAGAGRGERQNSQQHSQHLSPPRSERVCRKSYTSAATGTLSAEGRRGSGGGQQQWPDSPSSSLLMVQPSPHRSQSFRHRPRPNALLGDNQRRGGGGLNATATIQQNEVDSTPERRRSTPTIHRRASLCRGARGVGEPRIDVWPEAKPMSEAEERFLQLPDWADWTRVRQFNIDAKGAVIHRGDSFRRKRRITENSTKEDQQSQNINGNGLGNGDIEQQQMDETGNSSTRTSVSSSSAFAQQQPQTTISNNESEQVIQHNGNSDHSVQGPSCSYKICILGQAGAGKTSLIGQFLSSSAFHDSEELHSIVENGAHQQNGGENTTVSVNIGGHECELAFSEWDIPEQQEEIHSKMSIFHAFLLVYSIDRKASFRMAIRQLEQLRAENYPAPILLVGNKADLERKRAVMEPEVKNAVLTYDVPHFEVSVALNHDVDDLLVGIVAQVKESFRMNVSDQQQNNNNNSINNHSIQRSFQDSEEFHAAIRRFSQRKKRQMGVAEMDVERGKCMNLFEKLRKWRKGGTSNC